MYGKDKVASDSKKAKEYSSHFKNNRVLMRERAKAGLEVLAQHSLTDASRIAAIGYCFGGTVALELARSGAMIKGTVSFHGNLDTPNIKDAQNIRGKVLVLDGADDPHVSDEEVAFFKKEMSEAGLDWQMIIYGDAVHSFTNKDAGGDKTRGAAYNKKADERSWIALEIFFKEVFMQVSLADKIDQFKNKSGGKISRQTRKIMQDAMEEMKKLSIEEKSLNVGDKAPLFELVNATGEVVGLKNLLKKGPVVISFYRGHWCPYCSLELKALQEALPQIEKHGASLVAISPNLPDKSLSTKEKHDLTFEVLSDPGNKVAKEFGIAFQLPLELRPLYKSFGIDLIASNGDESYELPVPATYVVDDKGIIQHAFVNIDYTRRLEPTEIIAVLKNISEF